MDLNTIVTEVSRLARWAEGGIDANQPRKAKDCLVELRELPNDQPELEAGGATRESRRHGDIDQ
ncbi:hypothetical protein ES707_19998 [subsurface metagenome]